MNYSYLSKVIDFTNASPNLQSSTYIGPVFGVDYYTLNKFHTFNNTFFSQEDCRLINIWKLKNKQFNSCVFVIPKVHPFFTELINSNSFNNCTFCIEENALKLKPSITVKPTPFNKNNNNIIINSFVNELISFFGNDWSTIPNHLTNGLCINDLDLPNTTLPSNINFFNNIYFNTIHNTILPKIDFSKYSFNNKRLVFEKVTFNAESKFSNSLLKNRMLFCSLPALDFSGLKNITNTLHYYHCEFSDNTIFPEDELFFEKNFFFMCKLPKYNYSNYKLDSMLPNKCSFHPESILPINLIDNKHIDSIAQMDPVPNLYLEHCCLFANIENYLNFIEKYNDKLTDEHLYILFKRNNSNSSNYIQH